MSLINKSWRNFVCWAALLSCASGASLSELESKLQSEYKNHFKSLFVSTLSLRAQKPIPQDFSEYELVAIEVPSYKSRGYFKADFSYQNELKSMFFSYAMVADAYVLAAKTDLSKDQQLGIAHYRKKRMPIDKIPKNAVFELSSSMTAKTNIKKDRIFTTPMLKSSFLISKGDSVVVQIKDGTLSVYVDMIAMQSANLGQKIKLKNKDGKIFYGRVKSRNSAALLSF